MTRAFVFSLVLLSFICISFIFSQVSSLEDYGLKPRSAEGLIGVVSMPMLHYDSTHLINNVLALTVLLALGNIFHYKKIIYVSLFIILVNGVLLWIFGRSANHIGASGLVYGLSYFLIFEGLINRRPYEIFASILVVIIYGSALIDGITPGGVFVSWDGHLTGAIAGVMAATLKDKELE